MNRMDVLDNLNAESKEILGLYFHSSNGETYYAIDIACVGKPAVLVNCFDDSLGTNHGVNVNQIECDTVFEVNATIRKVSSLLLARDDVDFVTSPMTMESEWCVI